MTALIGGAAGVADAGGVAVPAAVALAPGAAGAAAGGVASAAASNGEGCPAKAESKRPSSITASGCEPIAPVGATSKSVRFVEPDTQLRGEKRSRMVTLRPWLRRASTLIGEAHGTSTCCRSRVIGWSDRPAPRTSTMYG